MLSNSRLIRPRPAHIPPRALAGAEDGPGSMSLPYRGFAVVTYIPPGDRLYGVSVYDSRVTGRTASLFARRSFDSREDAVAAGKLAVDLALHPGISGLNGFSFKSISKMFDKAGRGVADNAGTVGAVVGGVVGSVVPGAGTAAGAAIGAAAGGALQSARESQVAKKKASAAKAAAEKDAKAAEAAAAADTAAADAAAVAAERAKPAKKPIWPWLAGGGAALVVGGIALWLLLRRKNTP